MVQYKEMLQVLRSLYYNFEVLLQQILSFSIKFLVIKQILCITPFLKQVNTLFSSIHSAQQ